MEYGSGVNRAFSARELSFFMIPGALPQARHECRAFGAKHMPSHRDGLQFFMRGNARSSRGYELDRRALGCSNKGGTLRRGSFQHRVHHLLAKIS